MKNKLSVPKSRPLADFLPTITIKTKDFANEITNFNIKRASAKTAKKRNELMCNIADEIFIAYA